MTFIMSFDTQFAGAVGEAEWEFVVLLPLFDPPRHDTRETIQRCIERGVQVCHTLSSTL